MALTPRQEGLLRRHLKLVIEANKTTNITRIDSMESGELLHIEDSLTALKEMESAPSGLYADLGSGAGYPGIPLAIATGRKTYLVEARQKKAEILRAIASDLGISETVSIYQGRAELLAREKNSSFAVLTARALAKLSVLVELASPLLFQGGILICYKAQVEKEELDSAKRVGNMVGMHLVSDRKLLLSDGETERRILCYKREGKSQVKLPRQEGFAQKKPL